MHFNSKISQGNILQLQLSFDQHARPSGSVHRKSRPYAIQNRYCVEIAERRQLKNKIILNIRIMA